MALTKEQALREMDEKHRAGIENDVTENNKRRIQAGSPMTYAGIGQTYAPNLQVNNTYVPPHHTIIANAKLQQAANIAGMDIKAIMDSVTFTLSDTKIDGATLETIIAELEEYAFERGYGLKIKVDLNANRVAEDRQTFKPKTPIKDRYEALKMKGLR